MMTAKERKKCTYSKNTKYGRKKVRKQEDDFQYTGVSGNFYIGWRIALCQNCFVSELLCGRITLCQNYFVSELLCVRIALCQNCFVSELLCVRMPFIVVSRNYENHVYHMLSNNQPGHFDSDT